MGKSRIVVIADFMLEYLIYKSDEDRDAYVDKIIHCINNSEDTGIRYITCSPDLGVLSRLAEHNIPFIICLYDFVVMTEIIKKKTLLSQDQVDNTIKDLIDKYKSFNMPIVYLARGISVKYFVSLKRNESDALQKYIELYKNKRCKYYG